MKDVFVGVPLPRKDCFDSWSDRRGHKELVRATAPELGERLPRGRNRRKGEWAVEYAGEDRRKWRQSGGIRRGFRSKEDAERWVAQQSRKWGWYTRWLVFKEVA